MNLNVPEIRQKILKSRLRSGQEIVATDVSIEFDVSVDTIRRDIIALEENGLAKRVRGGALPLAEPAALMREKLAGENPPDNAMIRAASDLASNYKTIIMDGGSTILAVARQLAPREGLLVITPSPWIAIACQARDIEIFMLGGRLSARGGINVGAETRRQISELSAEIAFLGACGLDSEIGLSSDDFHEAKTKSTLADCAMICAIVTDQQKIGRRARHHTIAPSKIDIIISNAQASQLSPFKTAGAQCINV